MRKRSYFYFFPKLFFLLLIANSTLIYAQKGGLPLADEYYLAGEYAKAKPIYENFTADFANAQIVYEKYLTTLYKLNEYDRAEKFLKKMQKWDPINTVYKIDLALLYKSQNNTNDAKKLIDKIVKQTSISVELIPTTTEYLIKQGFFESAKLIFVNARRTQHNEYLYGLELAEIYKIEKNTDLMLSELVAILILNQNDKEYLKSKFQNYVTTEIEFKKFEQILIQRIQNNPNLFMYNDLLIWVYIQKREFFSAFVQAKAYDRLLKSQGNKLMEVGKIALENKDYENSIEIFEYIANNYKTANNYSLARKLKIQAKEEMVKSTFPIDQNRIRSLISDYNLMILELGKTSQTLDALRNIALLFGFYLDSKDTAKLYLEEAIQFSYADANFISQCKLDLGDIYLLKNEPWEATLLYSQVEKSQKETILGHEAKLRNAKLSYYIGQFEIAQEHLDVLKLATTREISNDAMDLSLFIIDNTGTDDDSTHQALQDYANVELLVYQNKYLQALSKLDSMLTTYKSHKLNDEIYFLEAKVYSKIGKFNESISKLETLGNLFKSDIYGDDAAFMLAKMYEENLNNPEKAKELYNAFLIDFPSSIFAVEARKRFRNLRGDNLN